jgi:hypothetical protein
VEEQVLPTPYDILARALDQLDKARRGLSDARDELKSDHRPLGTQLPAGHPEARHAAISVITAAKDAIDRAKAALWEGLDRSAPVGAAAGDIAIHLDVFRPDPDHHYGRAFAGWHQEKGFALPVPQRRQWMGWSVEHGPR